MAALSDAVIGGFIAGVMSPVIISWLQHRIIWRTQKRLELKYSIFQDAVRALSTYAIDCMDPDLQANKPSYKGLVRAVHFRPETGELMERTRGLVQAFFSSTAYSAYDEALRTPISHDNIPNQEFERSRAAAILAMAEELGIRNEPTVISRKTA